MGNSSGGACRALFRDYPDVLDVKQAGDLLGVCDKTVYRLIAEGSLHAMRVGRQHRIPKVNLMKYIRLLSTPTA